jgi:hypothetical protein
MSKISHLFIIDDASVVTISTSQSRDDWIAEFSKFEGFPALLRAQTMVNLFHERLKEDQDNQIAEAN